MKENVCIARFKAVVCLLAVCICGLSSCSSEEGDLRKPVIETLDDSFPTNCQVYVKGGVIPFHYAFTDDVELGNYNIEVHNNFDHHTHSTEAGDCPFDPVKKPVKPWVYNRDFSIPPHSLRHDARVEIPIPDDIDAFAAEIWENLNEENKISLYVRYIDLASGKYEKVLINKNK